MRADRRIGIRSLTPNLLALRAPDEQALQVLALGKRERDRMVGARRKVPDHRGVGLRIRRGAGDYLAEQLRTLSGKTHSLCSAMVIARKGQIVGRHRESVQMTMRTLSDQFIADYLNSEGDVLLGYVGGYRIEGRGIQLFSHIEGSHFAIMGLPLLPLLAYLRSEEILPV